MLGAKYRLPLKINYPPRTRAGNDNKKSRLAAANRSTGSVYAPINSWNDQTPLVSPAKVSSRWR